MEHDEHAPVGCMSWKPWKMGCGQFKNRQAQFDLESLELHNPPSIALQELTVGYTSLPEPVLTGLNHVFEPGRIHAIVGSSGSGKSTLVNAMLGPSPFGCGRDKNFRRP